MRTHVRIRRAAGALVPARRRDQQRPRPRAGGVHLRRSAPDRRVVEGIGARQQPPEDRSVPIGDVDA